MSSIPMQLLIKLNSSKASYNFLSGLQFACNYIIGPVSLLFIDHFLNRMRVGTVLFIGASSGNLFILGGLLIISCQNFQLPPLLCSTTSVITSIVLSSLLAGILGTFWFVCHPAYVNRMSSKNNKQLYFGLSSSIYYTAIIFANLYGYFLITSLGDFYFFLIMMAIAVSFNFLFLFLPQIQNKNSQPELNDLKPARPFYQELSFQAKRIISTLLEEKFRKIAWFFIVNGTYGSAFYLFQSQMILSSLEDMSNKKQKVFAVFLTAGVGQACGGLFSSLLGRKLNLIMVSYILLGAKYISISLALISYLYKIYAITFPAGFLFGLVITGSQTSAITILTNEVSQLNHSFAAYNLTQCLGNAITSLLWIFLSDLDFIYSIIVMYTITTIGVSALTYYYQVSEINNEVTVKNIPINNDQVQSLISQS